MKASVLREKFLSYFKSLDHEIVASSAVVPKNDPTLLFANAGMNQFKDVFLGNDIRSYKRAASVQKCIRAGGKHNDLDEVGKDGRHLTFFEMLGNWSFGDYAKREAIVWAWNFLTQGLGLDKQKLYVSIYKDDDESFLHWRDAVGIEAERIQRFGDIEKGDEENFWSMGPVGPCGPCTEIYIDLEPELPCTWGPGYPEDRYLELWNLVFMTSNRDDAGNLTDLPMCSVDTGMGLERIVSVMQSVESVYETDLFRGILEATARALGKTLTQKEILQSADLNAYRVIADHIRCLTFAISEGQPFSNDGRGYVLRRILRRAVRFGRVLGFEGPFLHKLSAAVVEEFSQAYPELSLVSKQCQEVIRLEEERFFRTLDRGIARFEEVAAKAKNAIISGNDAFVLYDTFGFPLDLTQVMAEERGLSVDEQGFKTALEEQRARSAEATKFHISSKEPWVILREGEKSEFVGYQKIQTQTDVLRYRLTGDVCELVLRQSPFYAEGGGQVGDQGTIESKDGTLSFSVFDTQLADGCIVHIANVREGFVTQDLMNKPFVASVCAEHRAAVSANHTSTHLLQAALKSLVSPEIHQAGSLVRADRFRFDFTFSRALTQAELQRVEAFVNEKIRESHPVSKHENVPLDEAKAMGAIAIFGEKYGTHVRVVDISPVSIELCGGIHVDNTKEIICLRIIQESAIAAGVRRIEATTRYGALNLFQSEREMLREVGETLSCSDQNVLLARIQKLVESEARLQKTVENLKQRLAAASLHPILATKQMRGDIEVYGARVQVSDRKEMLTYADLLRDKMGKGIAMIGAIIDDKPSLTCLVTPDCIPKYHAGKLVSACAAIIDGKGGGRPDSAQAGGSDSSQLDAAIAHIYELVS